MYEGIEPSGVSTPEDLWFNPMYIPQQSQEKGSTPISKSCCRLRTGTDFTLNLRQGAYASHTVQRLYASLGYYNGNLQD